MIPHEEKGSGERRREEAANGCMVCFFLSSGKGTWGKTEAKYICFACGLMDVMVCTHVW